MSRFRSANTLCRYLCPAPGRFLPPHTLVVASLPEKDRSTCADTGAHLSCWKDLIGTSSRGFASLTVEDPNAVPGKRASEALAVLRVYRLSFQTAIDYHKLIRKGLTLQHARLGKLREKLQQASEDTPYITKDKLLQLIQERYRGIMYTSRPLHTAALQTCLYVSAAELCQGQRMLSRPAML